LYYYLPTNNFRLTVDPEKVVANGTVPASLANQIKPIDFTLNRMGISRNNIMLLDFLATNDWERPVYFASTTGNDAYLGLQEHFQIEGMAYRLLPVKLGPASGQDLGGVNTDILYNNLVNKFGSGMEDPDVYLTEDNLRGSMSLRNIYGRLALELVAEGKMDSAIVVCDRIMELVPPESIPYNYFTLNIAEAYLKAGATEKGMAILDGMYNIIAQNLEYFFRFEGNKGLMVDDMKKHYLSMAHEVKLSAQRNGQTEMQDKTDALFTEFYDIYVSQMRF
jgi:hypothetical protein